MINTPSCPDHLKEIRLTKLQGSENKLEHHVSVTYAETVGNLTKVFGGVGRGKDTSKINGLNKSGQEQHQ